MKFGKKVRALVVGVAMLGAAIAGTVGASSEQAVRYQAPEVQAAVAPQAAAGENGGEVYNRSGNLVIIRCDYGNPNTQHTIREGQDSNTYCPPDTDQFQAYKDLRCVKYTGPGYADGWYRLTASSWFKVAGAAKAEIHAYTDARCGGKKIFDYVK